MNILPLNKPVTNRIGIIMYKYANNLLPPVINNMYTTNSDVYNYSTRQKHFRHVNKSNINIYSKSFVNTSARIWNAMQSEIEVNVSTSKFKIVFARTYTSFQIFKIGLLYNVLYTDSLPHYN